MKVLMFTLEGDTNSLAQVMRRQGDRVEVYVGDEKARKAGVGVGLVTFADIEPPLTARKVTSRGYDLVVFDHVKNGRLADEIKEAGVPVFGASRLMDTMELDRAYGLQVMRAAGIKTPPTTEFAGGGYDKAIALVTSTKKRYVYKPFGNQETSTTYVGVEWRDMVHMLKTFAQSNVPFILQEVVDGVEVSTEIWFNGAQAVNVNYTMEEKRFLPVIAHEFVSDLLPDTRRKLDHAKMGVNTGCMGNVVWTQAPGAAMPRLYTEGIGRAVSFLAQAGYRGVLDLNTIVNEHGVWGLEWTARFGYDAIYTFVEGLREPLAPTLLSVARGLPTRITWKDGAAYTGSVRLSVPPYPNKGASREGLPVIGVKPENAKHLWLSDVKIVDGQLVVAGFDGNIGSVTAYGSSVRACRQRVYRTIANLIIPDVEYRPDVGLRVEREIARLTAWGLLGSTPKQQLSRPLSVPA